MWQTRRARRARRARVLGAGALLALAAPLSAQVPVSGVVREDGTGRPLALVLVSIEGTQPADTTDSAGRFRLDAPAGTRIALFRLIGYRPLRLRLQLAKGDSATANADLVRESAQQLEPIETRAAPAAPRGVGVDAFEERRRLGFGKFIDSTELRRSEGRRLTDLLRGVPGVRMMYYVEDPARPWVFEWRAVAGRKESADGTPCWMSVVFDGSPIYRSGSLTRPPDFHRDLFEIASLEAVEVYRSPAEVPQEYGGASEQCGLILLWSRRHR
ncbi:MAG TPA: carboxypeptidase-like regulatory domain-containing protein [Gemmatimonadales bacterium]